MVKGRTLGLYLIQFVIARLDIPSQLANVALQLLDALLGILQVFVTMADVCLQPFNVVEQSITLLSGERRQGSDGKAVMARQ